MDWLVDPIAAMIVFAVPGMIVLALGLLFKRRSAVVLGGVMIVLLAFAALSTYWWSSGSETHRADGSWIPVCANAPDYRIEPRSGGLGALSCAFQS